MATVKYMERIQAGEKESFPPKLHSGSKVDDYLWWLDRPDLGLALGFLSFCRIYHLLKISNR